MALRINSILFAALIIATIVSVAHAQAQAEWLAAHNAARSAVGVAPLRWNSSAAAFALNWARGQAAKTGCPMEHSNRTDSKYGENIALNVLTSTPTMVVRDQWVSERAYYAYRSNSCSLGPTKCLHYTQVVWRKTTSVGCASARCRDKNFIFYVCDYFPAGNMDGKWPY
ncbi:hypothetical protein M758_8G125400 [Ceratodon purpureus]|nr:hypothetical protein M758_8G125400 [Ceratodon purpureus]